MIKEPPIKKPTVADNQAFLPSYIERSIAGASKDQNDATNELRI